MITAMAVPGPLRAALFSPSAEARLAALGEVRQVDEDTDPRDPGALAGLVRDADVLVSSWGCPPLDEHLLNVAPRLRLLAHTGATVKPFVTDASWARGVRVTQAGAGMAHAVAEVSLAFTLALLHQTPRFDHGLREGRTWDDTKASAPPRHELRGSRIGVVGASRTGRAYIALLLALGARVAVYDPYLTSPQAEAMGVTRASLDEVMRSSRVVALHAPSLPTTHHLIGERELEAMPDGAALVNTARSWLVDEAALVRQVASGRIDAAIDVFDEEPLPADNPLRGLPNVLLTPHEAAGTVEARRRQGDIVVAEVERFAAGTPMEHEVSREDLDRMG